MSSAQLLPKARARVAVPLCQKCQGARLLDRDSRCAWHTRGCAYCQCVRWLGPGQPLDLDALLRAERGVFCGGCLDVLDFAVFLEESFRLPVWDDWSGVDLPAS